jgi:4-alpha-glucanotransferase
MNDLDEAARNCGIEAGFHDVFGNWHAVSAETNERLVKALSAAHRVESSRSGLPSQNTVERAFQGDGRRVWGLAVQLYALRSRRNWGHGDFTDLKRLVAIAARAGAAAVGLNPLHALFPERAEQASPYGPNSRLFLNPLYIDVEDVPEFSGLGRRQAELADMRRSDLIAYHAIGHLKLDALRGAYDAFNTSASAQRRDDFESYRREQGEALLRFAAFEVLRLKYASEPWSRWPQAWRNPDFESLRQFRAENMDACAFQEFMQWTADRQLRACQDAARDHEMSIGLYSDLAVGIDPHGADAWSEQDAIVTDVSIGAPPDEFNRAGQNWGLAPFNPRSMAKDDFAPLRRLMRVAMRHAGAIRLDHVLGLNRLFLIPRGSDAGHGAYVRYPFEDTLCVIAQESNKARCIVIGEDLGTVPEGFRDTMARWGFWTYRVMLFEREQDGRFRAPGHYPAEALATFNTHDLPSFRGWMEGHDLKLKHSLGIDPGESDETRQWWQGALRRILAERAPDFSSDDFAAVATVLGATPSRLVMVPLEDILGVAEQINIPGTTDQHPNWARKLPVDLEDLDQHEGLRRVAQAFEEAGRKSG